MLGVFRVTAGNGLALNHVDPLGFFWGRNTPNVWNDLLSTKSGASGRISYKNRTISSEFSELPAMGLSSRLASKRGGAASRMIEASHLLGEGCGADGIRLTSEGFHLWFLWHTTEMPYKRSESSRRMREFSPLRRPKA